MASSSSLSTQWHVGHAVMAPGHCCTAYRRRYAVYAATPNVIAIVDVATTNATAAAAAATPALSIEARWRNTTRLYPLDAAEEEIAFVCGHPERDVVCVGTRQHGLYATSLTQPSLTAAAKLPRTVTGDATFSATFLFAEGANYLAFSSLLHSRPTDPTPHRLSLWCLDTQALLWRGAMAPLTSMCGFSFDLSFAACQAGKVCLFTVQQSNNNSNTDNNAAGASPSAVDGGGRNHTERNRLVVLSRHCSAVEELQDASYTCCIASPAEGEDTYLALTTNGFLVAFHATSGSVTRWMDCKVPTATGLSLCGEESLVLTGELTRFFHVGSWEFQGKIKLEVPSGLAVEPQQRAKEGGTEGNVFTSAVAADHATLLLFHRSGAMSFHAVEPKAATGRLSLHRAAYIPSIVSLYQTSCTNNSSNSSSEDAAVKPTSTVVCGGREPQWLVVSSALWAWWAPQALVFVSAATGALVAAYGVRSSCVTLHPASGAVILFDTQRRSLVAYGRTQTSPAAEVGVLACAGEEGSTEQDEAITSLASSATGESFYALVSLAKSALPPRLRRYRCGWRTVKQEEVSERGFYMDCMKFPDSTGNGGSVVATASGTNAGPATSVSLPVGTHTLLVHAGSGGSGATTAAAEGDRVVAVQRTAVVSVGLSGHRERATAPTYTHADPIQRVLPCRGGLLVLGTASCAFVQWKGTTAFRWAAKPLPIPLPAAVRKSATGAAMARGTTVTAAVALRRPDVVAVCVDRVVTLWQLSETPRLLSAGGTLPAPVFGLMADVEASTRRVQLWTLGGAGVDVYQLGPVDLAGASPAVAHADTVAAVASPVSPLREAEQQPQKTPGRGPRAAGAAVSPMPRATSGTPAAAVTAATAVSPLPLPSRRTPPPPPAAAAFTARQVARTPRNLASTTTTDSSSHTTALAEARRQRRTASARAPSSRQLSARFDELTGFYARQKQENQASEHPRTPRTGLAASTTAVARHTAQSRSSNSPSPEKDRASVPPTEFSTPRRRNGIEEEMEETAATPPRPATPPLPPTTGRTAVVDTAAAATAMANGVTASVVDVSALTVDSQVLRSAVAAAAATTTGKAGSPPATAVQASPLPWSDSPPQRGEPQLPRAATITTAAAAQRADDAVLRSSASTCATSPDRAPPPPPPPQPHPQQQQQPQNAASPPQVQLHASQEHSRQSQPTQQPSGVVEDSSSFSSEYFTVQARHLRESLLQLKEMLEQSEMAESSSDASRTPSDEAGLDELASLLTTVAAQLHQRQVRRSAESA